MKKKVCIDGSHPVCTSSDSKLAECVCWCAECKEYFAELNKAYKANLKSIRNDIREWA
jgi:uncharacterized protein YecT (DUF1311 family)